MGNIVQALDGYRAFRYRFFTWRYELPAVRKVTLGLGMAALTGLLAQVRIPLSFTPVPITGQVLAALLAGVLLGRSYGGLSQVLYVGLGAAGLPWFAALTGGLGVLTGVTGGYLVGMALAAAFVGYVNDRYVGVRSFWRQLVLMLTGVGVIYACGALQFAVVLGVGPGKAIALGVLPFVIPDLVKALIAASVATALLPKSSYNGEVDAGRYGRDP